MSRGFHMGGAGGGGGDLPGNYLIKDGKLNSTITPFNYASLIITEEGGYLHISARQNGAYGGADFGVTLSQVNSMNVRLKNGSSIGLGFISSRGSVNVMPTFLSNFNVTSESQQIIQNVSGSISFGFGFDTRYSTSDLYIKDLWYT